MPQPQFGSVNRQRGIELDDPALLHHCHVLQRGRCIALPTESLKEPLNNSAWSAFQSEKPQIVWCEPSDSSHSYGRGSQRARCGFSGETLSGQAFAGAPPRLDSLIWNDQTTLAQADPEPPAKAPSRPRRVVQGLLKYLQQGDRGHNPCRSIFDRLGEVFGIRSTGKVLQPGRRIDDVQIILRHGHHHAARAYPGPAVIRAGCLQSATESARFGPRTARPAGACRVSVSSLRAPCGE